MHGKAFYREIVLLRPTDWQEWRGYCLRVNIDICTVDSQDAADVARRQCDSLARRVTGATQAFRSWGIS